MDSGVIKIAAVAVGAYLLYEWLQSSGLWAQYFGGSNNFTTTSALDTYCSANPTATASMTVNGQNASAPCSQWLAALQSSAVPTTAPSSSPAGSTPATAAPASAVDPNLAAQLTAGMQKQIGASVGTISQWNWVLQNIVKSSLPIITASTPYGNSPITATQYLQEQQSLGMSGLGFTSPYSWGSRLVN